ESLAADLRSAFPDASEAARLHGIALLMLDRRGDARDALETALRLDPDNIEAASNLASAFMAEGDARAAVALLEQAVAARPGDAALHNNLANGLRATGDDARARDEYLAALAIAPGHLGAGVNLAAVEVSLGMLDSAEARLRSLLSVQQHPQIHLLLGHALHRRRRFAEAQTMYLEGAKLAPTAPEFPYQAGLMADEQHHYAEAAALYRRALQLDPDLPFAEGQLLFVLRRLCDWDAAKPIAERHRARVRARANDIDPFAFLAEQTTPDEQLVCAQTRATQVVREMQPLSERLHFEYAKRPERAPLKVGFVSAGFGARGGVPHATALLGAAFFEEFGRLGDIELHLFATTADDGSMTRQRLAGAAHALHEVDALTIPAIAQRVHDAAIDVLIDVDGWCAGAVPGVFALRPSPVQAGWLAYPGTSGAPFIDYLIADRFLIPESSRGFYSEAIAYLPRCYQPSDPTRQVGRPPPRAAFGLPDEAVVFASFNNAWKLNAASFARMCRVLREVPASVLWLLDAGREADARLRQAAHGHGVDPRRLVFSPALPHLQHLARYRLAHLFLDTNPYNAHTTASDAIWAGCPVLTRPGDTFASRVAGSINHHLGMPELIAEDDDAFVATAVRFGHDRPALATLRERLAAQREISGLFDMRSYARDFAGLLHEMDERHAGGVPSGSIVPQERGTRMVS
ncbi:MAG TPA: tetratricopeptide repeat protein, partial [Rhodanobacteraceae bacterium]|nr:tetratricopeptide repeat protein [Rhodanobacteraceae bacterium]